jgi:hypothetical protein
MLLAEIGRRYIGHVICGTANHLRAFFVVSIIRTKITDFRFLILHRFVLSRHTRGIIAVYIDVLLYLEDYFDIQLRKLRVKLRIKKMYCLH